MPKHKNKKSKKNKYGDDIVAYYARQKMLETTFGASGFLSEVSSEEVHAIANQIFGSSYYVPYLDMV